MELGAVTKFGKRDRTTPKKIDDDVISANYEFIVFFPIYGQFGAICKLDSRRIGVENYIFIESNRTKLKAELKFSNSFHNIALSKGTMFVKNAYFLLKNADIYKI